LADHCTSDANKQRSVPGAEWEAKEDAGRSVKEYLAVLYDAAFGGETQASDAAIWRHRRIMAA